MKDETINLVRCPNEVEGKLCLSPLEKIDNELKCSKCGTDYIMVEGIPILRESLCRFCDKPIVEGIKKCPHCGEPLPYPRPEYLSIYYEAHYGPYLNYTSRDDRFIPRALTEGFYQTISNLCVPYLNENSTALDIGCAFGRLSMELAKKAAFVIGIDYLLPFVSEALKIVCSDDISSIKICDIGNIAENFFEASLRGFGINNCDFIVGDAHDLPFDRNTFDFVLSSNLIDRVENPQKTIYESWRVLKKGGVMLITDPLNWGEIRKHPSNVDQWKCNLLDFFDGEKWKTLSEIDGIPFIFRYHSRHKSTLYNQAVIVEKIG